MSDTGKTAIVCVGGGMRSAYGAGFLYALGHQLHLKPDMVVGSSGDVANLFYFLNDQYDFLERAWLQILPTERFVSVRRIRPIIDVDYLVDDVMTKQIPLDLEKLSRSPVQYFVAITDATTGDVRYITNSDKSDPIELVRTTAAIPFFFGKEVALFGKNYFDGETGSTLQTHLDCAVARGATKILLIDDSSDARSTKIGLFIFSLLTTGGLRKALKRRLRDTKEYRQPEHARVVFVRPSHLGVRAVTNSQPRIKAAFKRGTADALARERELRTLFA